MKRPYTATLTCCPLPNSIERRRLRILRLSCWVSSCRCACAKDDGAEEVALAGNVETSVG
jgi:hypothetical protein